MPAAPRIPSYRHHKPSGQAVVTLNGRDVYLGKHDTPESRATYEHMISRWLANGRQDPAAAGAADRTVAELALAYLEYATVRYRHADGGATSELANVRLALRPLCRLFGDTPAREFGPKALKVLRHQAVADGLCRGGANRRASHIVRLFRWAADEEMVPSAVWWALKAVEGLPRGRSEARESEPVKPVADDLVDAVRPFVSRQVWAMIELQRLAGMRPGEIVSMRTGDIDRTGPVWVYKPRRHKTEHHGHERRVYLGPRAQTVLGPFLKADPDAFLFSAKEAAEDHRAGRRRDRKTPLAPSHRARRHKAKPSRPPGLAYTTGSYRRAIGYGCKKAGIPPWNPNRLRHACATEIRARYGLEAAQVVLGHCRADVTQVYAARDGEQAARVMKEIG
jgi:integrase